MQKGPTAKGAAIERELAVFCHLMCRWLLAHEAAYKFLTGNHLNAIMWCHKNLPIAPGPGSDPTPAEPQVFLPDLDPPSLR